MYAHICLDPSTPAAAKRRATSFWREFAHAGTTATATHPLKGLLGVLLEFLRLEDQGHDEDRRDCWSDRAGGWFFFLALPLKPMAPNPRIGLA